MEPDRARAPPPKHMESALVVFCRRPAPGVGKQRLARSIGVAAAHAVAEALLECTLEDVAAWPGPRVLSPADPRDTGWAHDLFGGEAQVVPQSPGNLGQRIDGVDRLLRAQGHAQLLYIGTDAPALDPRYLVNAAAALAAVEVVLGPARDGGVTLMGSREPWPQLAPLPWSEPGLGSALQQACRARGARIALLPTSFDVDELDDLPLALQALAADPRPARQRLCELLAPLVAASGGVGGRRALP
jgi:uncharacterized protein